MRLRRGKTAFLGVATAWFAAGACAWGAGNPESQWPQWRGPSANGASATANPPWVWGDGTGPGGATNIRWVAALPGRGNSTPIVWENRVYVTTAADAGEAATDAELAAYRNSLPEWQRKSSRVPASRQQFSVLALDRGTGAVVWRTDVTNAMPHEGTHMDGSWASASPATDGERVYAYFGSYGLHCLDMTGAVRWSRSFGALRMKMRFGEGASPVLGDDRLIVNCDHEGGSFVTALDKLDGRELWRVPRNEVTSWATPLAIDAGGVKQVVVAATGAVRGYRWSDGGLLWEVPGLTTNVVPSPVFGNGRVYAMSGFRGSAALAIEPGAAGATVAWTLATNTPYVPSPVLSDGRLYFLKGNDAVLSCVDAVTGMARYEAKEIEGAGGVYASPVAAAGRLYVLGRKGTAAVVAQGDVFKVLSRNAIADEFVASPAVAGGDLLLRGAKGLYCVAEAAGTSATP